MRREYASQNLATQTAALDIVEKVKVVPTKVPTAAALAAMGKPVDSKKKRDKRNTKCLFCAEKHRVTDCSVSPEEKSRIDREQRR